MIDSLAQGYHWTLTTIFSLTMPQIIMLSHAAHINSKRMDERLERKREREEGEEPMPRQKRPKSDPRLLKSDPIVSGNVRLSKLSQDFDKFAMYLADTSG